MVPICLERDRLERLLKYFPHIHLFGNVYLMRNRRYHAKIYGKRFMFGLWGLHIMKRENKDGV